MASRHSTYSPGYFQRAGVPLATLPAQAPDATQRPSSNSGPTQEVENQAFGTGLPKTSTGNG